MSSPLKLEIDQSLAVITLNTPERANVLDLPMARAFAAAVQAIAHDKTVRAVLITAEGRQFCAGGDIKVFANASRPLPDVLQEVLDPIHEAMKMLALLPLPIVCAINGAVGGGGIGLALCGDLVLAAESMKLRGGYSAIGLTPDVGSSWFVTRRAGAAKAKEIFLTNRPFTAAECCDIGLVDEVCADHELPHLARKLAQQLAQGPQQAQVRIKALIESAQHHGLNAHLDREREAMLASGATDDAREGIRAFLEKRAPIFHSTKAET
jgi:2-(1,2-epoxy-1,2-dihydrophenyl)acetyl-CoA isomerase